MEPCPNRQRMLGHYNDKSPPELKRRRTNVANI